MAQALLKLSELSPGTLEYAQTLRNALDELEMADPEYAEQMREWYRAREAHLNAVNPAERPDHAAILTPRLLTPLHLRGVEFEALSVMVALAVWAAGIWLLGGTLDSVLLSGVAATGVGYGTQVIRDRVRYRRLLRRGLPVGAHEVWGEA